MKSPQHRQCGLKGADTEVPSPVIVPLESNSQIAARFLAGSKSPEMLTKNPDSSASPKTHWIRPSLGDDPENCVTTRTPGNKTAQPELGSNLQSQSEWGQLLWANSFGFLICIGLLWSAKSLPKPCQQGTWGLSEISNMVSGALPSERRSMSRSYERVMKEWGWPKGGESHKQGYREVCSLQPNIGSVRHTGLLKQYRRAQLRSSQSASDFRNVFGVSHIFNMGLLLRKIGLAPAWGLYLPPTREISPVQFLKNPLGKLHVSQAAKVSASSPWCLGRLVLEPYAAGLQWDTLGVRNSAR